MDAYIVNCFARENFNIMQQSYKLPVVTKAEFPSNATHTTYENLYSPKNGRNNANNVRNVKKRNERNSRKKRKLQPIGTELSSLSS